ncbi:MAG: GAF domain-containing protein [Candidatus Eremiobacteraeota bacterium]|nr:GAF domain-containing protein [Candidatus Eremiobacteraeota bacterium]
MAAGAISSASVPQHDLRWKWLLLGLCAIGGVLLFANFADNYGLGMSPWAGWWDSVMNPTDRAYVTQTYEPVAGGSSANAGLRDGDLVDLREQSLEGRVQWIFEPVAKRQLKLRVHRGNHTFIAEVNGRSDFEHNALENAADVLTLLSAMWFLACATLVAARRWWAYEARVLSLAMLCQLGCGLLLSGYCVVPSPELQLLIVAVSSTLLFAEVVLLVTLSSRYGERVAWRLALEWFSYAANAVIFLVSILALFGIATLWIDPLPFTPVVAYSAHLGFAGSYFAIWAAVITLALVGTVICALAGVATSGPAERARAAWLLLPLPLALLGFILGIVAADLPLPWVWSQAFFDAAGSVCWFLGGVTVTYALLKRRVLDFGFVLSRAVVVSIVGLIVVVAFVLLEWVLGSVLTGVSHATGLIANAVLALIIGVSLSYIHKRADQFVDATLFRKRHQDERALLDFSKEAAYVTDANTLLDQSVEKVRRHIDARSGSLLLDEEGTYSAVRSFGEGDPASVSENDAAILALKTWHKPIDPHHYDTTLHAALALPMLSRGRLLGVLSLGERAGGEAYAPDEVEALSQFAHGVGSALDALSVSNRDGAGALQIVTDRLASLDATMRALPEAIAAHLRDGLPGTASPGMPKP